MSLIFDPHLISTRITLFGMIFAEGLVKFL